MAGSNGVYSCGVGLFEVFEPPRCTKWFRRLIGHDFVFSGMRYSCHYSIIGCFQAWSCIHNFEALPSTVHHPYFCSSGQKSQATVAMTRLSSLCHTTSFATRRSTVKTLGEKSSSQRLVGSFPFGSVHFDRDSGEMRR